MTVFFPKFFNYFSRSYTVSMGNRYIVPKILMPFIYSLLCAPHGQLPHFAEAVSCVSAYPESQIRIRV